MMNWNEVEQELKKIDLKKTFETHRKEWKEIEKRSKQGAQNFEIFIDFFNKIQKSLTSPSEMALLQLITILFLTEGPLGFYINWYSYYLILEEHHDLWHEENQKFSSSFEEVIKVPLSVKLEFLKRHGFKSLSEICPRTVRNAIAHYDFHIEIDGTINIRAKKLSMKELENLIRNVIKILNLIKTTISS